MRILHISSTYGLEAVGGATEAASRRFGDDLDHGKDAWFVCAQCNVVPTPKNVSGTNRSFCGSLMSWSWMG